MANARGPDGPAATDGRARRERRARLSKQEVIDAAIGLLRKDPFEPLTFERIAAAMNASPMSLYVHIGNREALLDAVADSVLRNFRVDIDRRAPWQEQVRAWVIAVFQHLRETPAVSLLLARARSGGLTGWVPLLAEMMRCLEGLPLEAEELARVVRWLDRSTISLAIAEAVLPTPSAFFGIIGPSPRCRKPIKAY